MADKTATAPLTGLRVVEFTENMVGPYIGLLLAALGAEVIKVERPGGESMRTRNKGLFASVNRGKKSVVLDMKKDGDKSAAMALIRTADIVTESFRPGVADKLGIGYKSVAAVNPRAICVSISAYGQTGPRSAEPAYDPIIAGYAGIAAQTGQPGSPPDYAVGVAVADMAPVFAAVISIMGAVMQRNQTGRGQHLDVSMLDTALLFMMTRFGQYGADPASDGRRARVGAGVFAAGDGKYLAIHTAETHFWNSLLDVLGADDLAEFRDKSPSERQRHAERLNGAIQAHFRTRGRDEWVKRLVEKGVPAGPVVDVDEVLKDPHLLARHAFEEAAGARYPRFPVRLPGLDAIALAPAVDLGTDNRAVLAPLGKAPA